MIIDGYVENAINKKIKFILKKIMGDIAQNGKKYKKK